MEIKHFKDFEELEFNLFKNISLNISSVKDEIRKKFMGLFDMEYYEELNLFRIVKILDGKVICEKRAYSWASKQEKKYCVFKNNFKLKEGQYILIKQDSKYAQNLDKFWIVENNVLNESFLDEKIEKGIKIKTDTIQNEQILTKKIIGKAFNKTLKRIEQEKEQRQLQNINKEKEKEELFKKYKKESIGNFGGIEIYKNKITLSSTKYTLKRNVNKIFDGDFFNEPPFYSGYNFDRIEYALIEKKESYIKQEEDKGNWDKIYNIEFGKNEAKINGIKVSKSRVSFILARTKKETPKEKIKLLNELIGMKDDILNLKEIKIDNYYINIDISLIDNDNFKVKLMNITKNINWDTLKKHFFEGGKKRKIKNLNKKELLEFVKDFGVGKQNFYDYLKKVVLLKNLE